MNADLKKTRVEGAFNSDELREFSSVPVPAIRLFRLLRFQIRVDLR